MRKKQSGMTTIELSIVLAVMALLIAGAIGAMTYIDSTKLANTRTQILERIYSGIVDYASNRGGSAAGITTADCASTGADTDSVYGGTWSCSWIASSNRISVTYPVNDDDAGARIASTFLTANYPTLAVDATYNSTSGDATIVFSNP